MDLENSRPSWRCCAVAATLVIALAALTAAAAETPPPDRAVVVRLDEDGGARWRVALEPDTPATDGERSTLRTGTWYPPFPDLVIQRLDDAEPFDPVDARGEVLLLDFWASWCEPCLRELPQLQQLQDEWRDRGLRVVTINSGEPPMIALDYLEALGVTLPAGTYDRALRKALPVRSLPTLILVDPQGRMRQRWNGYSEGLIEHVSERVVELLDPATSGDEDVAQVLDGHGRLQIGWARRTGSTGGLAIVEVAAEAADAIEADDPTASPSIVVATDTELVVLDADGEIVRRAAADRAVGAMRRGVGGGLLGFRPGGRRIVRLDRALAGEAMDLPSHVLDAADLPVGADGSSQPWAAMVEGLQRFDGEGWVGVGEPGEVRALAVVGERVAAVRAPAVLAVYSTDGTSAGERELPLDDAWHVLSTAGGELVSADGQVTQIVETGLVPGRGPVLAVATRGGVLALLDPVDGRVLHRSVWERLGPLTGGDLDGDGVDELVLSAGGRVFLLRWIEPEAAAAR